MNWGYSIETFWTQKRTQEKSAMFKKKFSYTKSSCISSIGRWGYQGNFKSAYLFIYFTKRFSVHKNTYKQKQTNKILTNKNELTKQKQPYKKQQRQQIFARKSFVCVGYFFVLFVFFALFVRFVRVKSFHKIKRKVWNWLDCLIYLYCSVKSYFYHPKKLANYFR